MLRGDHWLITRQNSFVFYCVGKEQDESKKITAKWTDILFSNF